MPDLLHCGHPASSAIVDEHGVSVCPHPECSDMTPATPYRKQHPRRCWERPAGVVAVPFNGERR